ncbi:hypothetical protein PoB_001505300 [Plakobranchus ocellatus]|uniref:Uncharacterized protein n=1 Tax=Plakobranchus ocellatus TaxID=259542 RepID=A0AAV3Z199_9GAST|nr:hypothetical protein PoB_001505300 [Plakobranchus ocellatus]
MLWGQTSSTKYSPTWQISATEVKEQKKTGDGKESNYVRCVSVLTSLQGRWWHNRKRIHPEICMEILSRVPAPPPAPWSNGGP